MKGKFTRNSMISVFSNLKRDIIDGKREPCQAVYKDTQREPSQGNIGKLLFCRQCTVYFCCRGKLWDLKKGGKVK